MDSGELYDLFRSDVVDTAEPYLWTDTEVYAYMNDAYFMFVRRTGGINDITSAATQVPVVTGAATADLDPSIMRIRQAVLASTEAPLTVINAQDVEYLTAEDYGRYRRIARISTPGRVTHMIIGEQENLCRWVGVPEEDDTVELLIERLPLDPIVGAGQAFTDVAEEHHLHFLMWMRNLAYRKQDTDTFDLTKADQERDNFLTYCEQARVEKANRRHKVRVVRYGGL